jgi:prepilin-type processing-associated H-X9-DG protein
MQGWKNNLYGDGHVESRHAKVTSFAPGGNMFLYNNQYPSDDEIRPGWGGSQSNLVPAMW